MRKIARCLKLNNKIDNFRIQFTFGNFTMIPTCLSQHVWFKMIKEN